MMKHLLALIVGATVVPASADVLSSWDFNTDDGLVSTGTTLPVVGSGTLGLVGGATSFFTSGSPSDPAVFPLDSSWSVGNFPAQGSGSGTAGFMGQVSTAGYGNVTLSFDYRNQPSANKWFAIETSSNAGVSWNTVQTFAVAQTDTWFNITAALPGTGNAADFAFRVVAVFAPNTTEYAATEAGYNGDFGLQVDRLELSAAPVPEPSTYAMLLLGGAIVAGMGAVRHARRA